MSKLSFRPRALDATKPMPIYWKDELSDLQDYSVLNRAVPQMPSGMEKEEESEHHLQRAISVQQVYGDTKVMVIPVPEAEVTLECYNNLYKKTFRMPKHYIHNQAQALNSILEQEQPDYDLDSDDERWLKDTKKRTGIEIDSLQFEEMFDRLEKSSGNQLVTLQEAKLLLKEDDDLIKAVHDYWLKKRNKMKGQLIYQVRQERRDGSSSNDCYVAFRRRTEKMQTRKNRKNDESSYEKMLKLRRDLSRAVTVLALVKRREKSKRELLHLTLEIFEKRFQMKDWDGKYLRSVKKELLAQKARAQFFLPGYKRKRRKSELLSGLHKTNSTVTSISKGEIKRDTSMPKKTKKKRQHELFSNMSAFATPSGGHLQTGLVGRPKQSAASLASRLSAATLKSQSSHHVPQSYQEVVDTMKQYEFQSSSDDETKDTPGISSPAEAFDTKKLPDGAFTFRRKPGCAYYAPQENVVGDWPWMRDPKHRYSLTSIKVPEKCVGFARRRVGRGGRIHLDRAFHPYDREIQKLDLGSEHDHEPPRQHLRDILQEIKKNRWRHFRPSDAPRSNVAAKKEENDSERDAMLHWNSPIYPDTAHHKEGRPLSLSRKNSRFSSPKHKRAATSRSLELDKSSVQFAMSALVTVATSTTTVPARNSIGVSRIMHGGRLTQASSKSSTKHHNTSLQKCVTCGGIVPPSATLTNSRTKVADGTTLAAAAGGQQRAVTLSVTSQPRTTVIPTTVGVSTSKPGGGTQTTGVPALIKINSTGSVGTVIYPQQGTRSTQDDVSKSQPEQYVSVSSEGGARKLLSSGQRGGGRAPMNVNVNFTLPANVLIKSDAVPVSTRTSHSAPSSPRAAVVHMLPTSTPGGEKKTPANAKTISLNLANLITTSASLPVTSSASNSGKITIDTKLLKSLCPVPTTAAAAAANNSSSKTTYAASAPAASDKPGAEVKSSVKKMPRSSDDPVNHTVQIDIGSPQTSVSTPAPGAMDRIVSVPTNKNAKAPSRPMEVT